MKLKQDRIRIIALAISELCALVTLVWMLRSGSNSRRLLAAATVLLLLLPDGMERLLRCRISQPVYFFCLAYALASMAGQCWDIYYTVLWWDKMLHISGGVLFAMVGVYLFEWLVPERRGTVIAAVFGLLFSVAVAVVWEFVEFGMDIFLGTDMQNDTVITDFCSYLLGSTPGTTGTIRGITSVLIDGVPLPVEGYLDVGLIDTMLDMILESAGAVLTSILLVLDRGKHPPIIPRGKQTP